MSTATRNRQIFAAVIGNALEWYDFVIYGFMTVIISRLFFPADSEYASLLIAMATFGVGFFMRPVGGVLIGLYADRRGRKAALQLIILLMTIATAMIAFAPTYAAIGIAAPAIMVLARLLQGAATGGEFASATAFLIESSPPERRGFFGSLQMVGQSIAALSGATAGMLVTQGLTPEQIDDWGWRLPFLFGLLIGPVGLWMRRHLSETEEFVAASQDETQHLGLIAVLREHLRDVLVCFGLVVSATIMFYVVLIYMPTYAKTQLNIPLKDAFTAQVAGLIFLTVLIPLFGILSDRIGRRAVLMLAALLYLVLTYPMMAWMLAEPSLIRLAIMQVALCSAIAVGFGAISTALAEQFPVRQRSTGLALAYNMAVMIFGGFAQLIVTWLIKETGSLLAPSFYVMFGATIGLVAAYFINDRRKYAEGE
ncbi:MAG: MFS transporter [Oxalobacteraceae bacterium]|jgi:MFS family permease|nr:MFS transporter [Oxalobacteraceae bacterium]